MFKEGCQKERNGVEKKAPDCGVTNLRLAERGFLNRAFLKIRGHVTFNFITIQKKGRNVRYDPR
jgi:hypothetical protein